MKKNSIIIDNVTFTINNFNGTGIDYRVYASAQDVEESDMYDITIVTVDKEGYDTQDQYTIYIDSCGNMEGDAPNDDLTQFVVEYLYVKRQHGIIRGF